MKLVLKNLGCFYVANTACVMVHYFHTPFVNVHGTSCHSVGSQIREHKGAHLHFMCFFEILAYLLSHLDCHIVQPVGYTEIKEEAYSPIVLGSNGGGINKKN